MDNILSAGWSERNLDSIGSVDKAPITMHYLEAVEKGVRKGKSTYQTRIERRKSMEKRQESTRPLVECRSLAYESSVFE